jgi:hypothetical protein
MALRFALAVRRSREVGSSNLVIFASLAGVAVKSGQISRKIIMGSLGEDSYLARLSITHLS